MVIFYSKCTYFVFTKADCGLCKYQYTHHITHYTSYAWHGYRAYVTKNYSIFTYKCILIGYQIQFSLQQIQAFEWWVEFAMMRFAFKLATVYNIRLLLCMRGKLSMPTHWRKGWWKFKQVHLGSRMWLQKKLHKQEVIGMVIHSTA